jgi:hypothetical protein
VKPTGLCLAQRLFGAWLLCQAWPASPLGAAAPFVPPGVSPSASADAPALSAPNAPPAAAGAISLSGIRMGVPPQALLDGQWLAPGAMVRGARLVAVSADAVQLRAADGQMQRLALTPQVDLRRTGAPLPPPAAPGAARPTQAVSR